MLKKTTISFAGWGNGKNSWHVQKCSVVPDEAQLGTTEAWRSLLYNKREEIVNVISEALKTLSDAKGPLGNSEVKMRLCVWVWCLQSLIFNIAQSLPRAIREIVRNKELFSSVGCSVFTSFGWHRGNPPRLLAGRELRAWKQAAGLKSSHWFPQLSLACCHPSMVYLNQADTKLDDSFIRQADSFQTSLRPCVFVPLIIHTRL